LKYIYENKLLEIETSLGIIELQFLSIPEYCAKACRYKSIWSELMVSNEIFFSRDKVDVRESSRVLVFFFIVGKIKQTVAFQKFDLYFNGS